jgi:hypothetical protein
MEECGDEVDETFASAGFLHHQHAARFSADGLDCFKLAVSKSSYCIARAHPQELQCTVVIENAVSHWLLEA